MRIDLSKNAADNVFALLNEGLNTTLISSQSVQLGTPQPHVGQGGRNTKIAVVGVPNKGVMGSKEYYYRRLGLLENVENPSTSILLNETATLAALKTRLVQDLQLRSDEVDLIGPLVQDQPTITLQAKSGSLVYLETPVVFNLTWVVRQPLSNIGTDIWFLSNTPFTPQSVLDKLEADYGAEIALTDLETFVIPDMSGGGVFEITLTAKSDSPAWSGSTTISLLLGDGPRLHTHLHITMPGWFV